MNWVDILILAVFVVAVVTGFRRGLIGQVSSIAAVVIGLIGCRMFGSTVSGWFGWMVPDSLESGPMAEFIPAVVANALIYTLVYYVVRIAGKLLRLAAKLLLMGPLDRALGVVFSLFKWCLGLSIVLNLWLALYPDSDAVSKSTVGGGKAVVTVMEIAPWLWGTVSAELAHPDGEADDTQSTTDAVAAL